LDILSVKKETKLSASEVGKMEVDRSNSDLRWSSLLTDGVPEMKELDEETRLE